MPPCARYPHRGVACWGFSEHCSALHQQPYLRVARITFPKKKDLQPEDRDRGTPLDWKVMIECLIRDLLGWQWQGLVFCVFADEWKYHDGIILFNTSKYRRSIWVVLFSVAPTPVTPVCDMPIGVAGPPKSSWGRWFQVCYTASIVSTTPCTLKRFCCWWCFQAKARITSQNR